MTEVLDTEVLDTPLQGDEDLRAALQMIDRGLGEISERQLVSSSEMADLLLDLRSMLARIDSQVSPN